MISYTCSLDLQDESETMKRVVKISVFILLAVIAVVTLVGWALSWRAARFKDQALLKYQLESKQAIAEANKAASIANQNAAEANLELARLETKMLPRQAAMRITRGRTRQAQRLILGRKRTGHRDASCRAWRLPRKPACSSMSDG